MRWVATALGLAVVLVMPAAPAAGAASEDGPFHFAMAKMLAGEGNIRGALDAFAKAVKAAPDEAYLRIEFAEFLYRIRRLDESAEQAAAAYRLAPDTTDVLRMYGQVQLARAGNDERALAATLEVFEALRAKTPEDISGMMALGQIYSSLDRLEDAADVYEEVVSHHPDNRRLNRVLVEALARAGRMERAEEVLREIVRLDDEALETRLRLAGLESERGNHAAAVEILRSAGPEIEDDNRLRGLLAHELFRHALSPGVGGEQRQRNLDEALEIVRSVRADAPDLGSMLLLESRLLLALDRTAEAIELLQELRRREPDDVTVATQLAQALEQSGDVDGAVQLLQELSGALNEDEEATEVRLRLAGLHARNGDWRGVAAATGQLLEAGGSGALARSGLHDQVLGLHLDALVRLERFEAALDRLRDEEERSGVNATLLLRRAEILAADGRSEEALAALRRPEVADAQGPQLALERARLLLTLDEDEEAAAILSRLGSERGTEGQLMAGQVFLFEERYAEAIPYLRRALAAAEIEGPALLDLHFWLGMAHERTGAYEEATGYFEKVLELEPEHGGALNYLGYMWADLGTRLEEALTLIERAVSLEPDNGAYIDSLGWAHFRLGQYEEAQHYLERAAELVPDDPTILEHLGDLYVEMGRRTQARRTYERVLKINSEENVEQVRRKLNEL